MFLRDVSVLYGPVWWENVSLILIISGDDTERIDSRRLPLYALLSQIIRSLIIWISQIAVSMAIPAEEVDYWFNTETRDIKLVLLVWS